MFNKIKNKIITKNTVENKTFSFQKGDVSLNFTLRIDIKDQIKNFIELLDEAKKDLINQLNK